MKFSLSLFYAFLGLASAKDLSIDLLNSDWKVENECSAELDFIHEALLAHLAEIMPDRFDRPTKSHYDCPKYCEDIPDSLCKHFTRGYCTGKEKAEEIADDFAEDLVALMPEDFDMTTGGEHQGSTEKEDTFDGLMLENSGHRELRWHCPTFCRSMSRYYCALLTYNYCSGNWNSGRVNPQDYLVGGRNLEVTDSSAALEKDNVPDAMAVAVGGSGHRELRWHCPTYCRSMSRYYCALLTRNYCTGNWNSGRVNPQDYLVGGRNLAIMDSSAIQPEDSGHHQLSYHCPTYCRRIPSWLCVRLSYGHCSGENDESPEDMTAKPALRGTNTPVDDDCNMAIAAMEAKIGELVSDLEDQDCAHAIIKANVMFKCSAAKVA